MPRINNPNCGDCNKFKVKGLKMNRAIVGGVHFRLKEEMKEIGENDEHFFVETYVSLIYLD